MSVLQGLLSGNSKDLDHKIFLGINFHGNDFVVSEGVGGGAIVGKEYLSLLLEYRLALQWDEKSEEHMFIYADNEGIKHSFLPIVKATGGSSSKGCMYFDLVNKSRFGLFL
ncbi:hypothetical protein MKX01_027367 [Papaver californicum]|nr:hypothetical protein MKX01_027367 [Papaver californicum]